MSKYNRVPTRAARVVRGSRPLRRKRRPHFAFRFLLLLMALGVLGAGAWLGLTKTYEKISQAEITNWHVKKVEVNGVSGTLLERVTAASAPYQGQAFPSENVSVLRKQIEADFPMLTGVSVSRKLLSGVLKINAQLRKPVAQLMLPDGSVRYLDEKSVVYEDNDLISPTGDLIRIEFNGAVPAQLDESLVGMVRGIIKLQKKLPFSALKLDTDSNRVVMTLPDKSEILFGQALNLKNKVERASAIMDYAREHLKGPVQLDFSFFEYNRVFLTQKPH